MIRTVWALTGEREELLDAGTETADRVEQTVAAVRRKVNGTGAVLRMRIECRQGIAPKPDDRIVDVTAARCSASNAGAWLAGVNGPPAPHAVEVAAAVAAGMNA